MPPGRDPDGAGSQEPFGSWKRRPGQQRRYQGRKSCTGSAGHRERRAKGAPGKLNQRWQSRETGQERLGHSDDKEEPPRWLSQGSKNQEEPGWFHRSHAAHRAQRTWKLNQQWRTGKNQEARAPCTGKLNQQWRRAGVSEGHAKGRRCQWSRNGNRRFRWTRKEERVPGTIPWLKNHRRGLVYVRKLTIAKVQKAREDLNRILRELPPSYDRHQGHRKLDEAVRMLQYHTDDLDHQFKRQAHLDDEGVYVYDERFNRGFRESVVLTPEAGAFNDSEVRSYRKKEEEFLKKARRLLKEALGHTPPPRVHDDDGPTMEEAIQAQDEAEQKMKKQAEDNRNWRQWEDGGGTPEASRGWKRGWSTMEQQEVGSNKKPRGKSWPAASAPANFISMFLQHPHEVRKGDGFDVDWTAGHSREMELALRQSRNIMMKEQLQRGIGVAYRSSGWSCWPRIHSGDITYLSPIKTDDRHKLKVDDIVFCAVQPGNRFFCHPIHKIEWTYWKKTRQWEEVYTIGNVDRSRVNGTCFFDGIYGKFDWAEH